MDITSTGMQSAMTDMINFHTYPIGGADMFTAGVLVVDSQLLKFTDDVIHGPRVHVPIGIDSI